MIEYQDHRLSTKVAIVCKNEPDRGVIFFISRERGQSLISKLSNFELIDPDQIIDSPYYRQAGFRKKEPIERFYWDSRFWNNL